MNESSYNETMQRYVSPSLRILSLSLRRIGVPRYVKRNYATGEVGYLLDRHIPAYRLLSDKQLDEKVEKAIEYLHDCNLCPRRCGVDRYERRGACLLGHNPIVNVIAPHFGEESCLQGMHGSGTVFFSGCNLRCVFCQNWDISHKVSGFELDAKELAQWMLKLQNEGRVHNINFVTPEHVVPSVVMAIVKAARGGLNIPIVYNTSAYDSIESIDLLDGLVDIYMPDMKLWTQASSKRLLKAEDYPENSRAVIKRMHDQVGPLMFGYDDGLARRGVLVRHLVMPNYAHEGEEIVKWLASELGTDTYIHIMEQYYPSGTVGKCTGKDSHKRYPELNRHAQPEEIDRVVDAALGAGLTRLYGFEDRVRNSKNT